MKPYTLNLTLRLPARSFESAQRKRESICSLIEKVPGVQITERMLTSAPVTDEHPVVGGDAA